MVPNLFTRITCSIWLAEAWDIQWMYQKKIFNQEYHCLKTLFLQVTLFHGTMICSQLQLLLILARTSALLKTFTVRQFPLAVFLMQALQRIFPLYFHWKFYRSKVGKLKA